MTAPLSRELIVETARARIEAEGPDSLSLRAVARDLEVTAPALYAYVDDKSDLLAAVATAHFEELVAAFEAVEETEPIARMRSLARAYIDHALRSPGLFRLMFRYPPSPAGEIDPFPPAVRAFEVAAVTTRKAVAEGLLGVDDADMAAMTMWAAAHGTAEVLLMGFGFDEAATEALVSSVIDTVLAGQVNPLAD